jgi:hypothetical protein
VIVAWREIAAAQISNEVRTQGGSRYKRKVHFLGIQRKEHVSTPEIDEQIEGVLTLWRRKKGKGQDTKEIDRGRDAHQLETVKRERKVRSRKENHGA